MRGPFYFLCVIALTARSSLWSGSRGTRPAAHASSFAFQVLQHEILRAFMFSDVIQNANVGMPASRVPVARGMATPMSADYTCS